VLSIAPTAISSIRNVRGCHRDCRQQRFQRGGSMLFLLNLGLILPIGPSFKCFQSFREHAYFITPSIFALAGPGGSQSYQGTGCFGSFQLIAAKTCESRHNRLMSSFVSELKRRNVLRVAAAYALVSWILIEAGSVLLPTFGAPDWFFRIYVILIVAGFVLSVIIAWVFEITSDGVKRERDLDRSSYEPGSRGGGNYFIIGLLVVALSISITFNITGMRGDALDLGTATTHNSVAVLPFTSRSTVEENQFFTDGIHEDILMRLAEIKSLRVISRTSVNEYRDTGRNLREIAGDLGVTTIVVGSVQRAGDDVRISVQLIDAASDQQIWSNTFDRKLSIESVFEVQSEISAQIATSLLAALTPEQEIRLAKIPTDNIEAYAEYVAGRENLSKRNYGTLVTAREQFERAVELDPDYADAHTALAETVLVTLSNHISITPTEAHSIATKHLAEALKIDPQMPQAYAVQGLMQTMQWEGTRIGDGNLLAAASFEKALELNPNLADAYVWFSSLRRSEGQIEKSIDLLTTALLIDPLSRIPYVNLPSSLAMEGQNERTIELLLDAVKYFPDWSTPHNYLSTQMQGLGRLDEAVAWGQLDAELSEDPMVGGNLLGIYQDFGDDNHLAEFFEAFPETHPLYPMGMAYRHWMQRDYEEALTAVEAIVDDPAFPSEFTLPVIIGASMMTGEFDKAYEYLIKGSPTLKADSKTTVDRFNLQFAVYLAYVEQQRNHPQAAAELLRQAERILRGLPRLGMAGYGIRDVHVLTLQGRENAALEALAQAVDEGFVSTQSFDGWPFDQDPIIEPLRADPRFDLLRQRITEKIEKMRENVAAAESTGDWSALLALADSV
jgi:TolB-like protein